LVSLFFVFTLISCFFKYASRYSSFIMAVHLLIKDSTSSLVGKFLLRYLFFVLLAVNVLGNIPLNSIPTMFYSLTLTLSLMFWVPLIICVCYSDFRAFLSHMLPYGSPLGLILFLPLIEIFSQLIRPFTLMIRLSTNLSSGHIMMYMFSYFTLLSSALSPFIYVVLIAMFVLELCISALQAYIFVSLLVLYANETL
jgi:F-type H+-transporting ATPase subunit a